MTNMLLATYENGREVRFARLKEVSFEDFQPPGLQSLRCGAFVYHREYHGPIEYWGKRCFLKFPAQSLRVVFIIVTSAFKIYIHENGAFEIRTDWKPNDALYREFIPGNKAAPDSHITHVAGKPIAPAAEELGGGPIAQG